jgi:hypothetical protein
MAAVRTAWIRAKRSSLVRLSHRQDHHGKKAHAVGWLHDGSAAGRLKLGYDNNWVVAAITVTLSDLRKQLRETPIEVAFS